MCYKTLVIFQKDEMMPPRKKFDLSRIMDAAFQILRRDGFRAVTARNVAAELGSSTTPIYWAFESMDDVEQALTQKTTKLMSEYQTKKYTDNVLLNMAIGYVNFAREEPNLFQFLQIENQKPYNPARDTDLGERMAAMMGEKPPLDLFGKIDQKSVDAVTLQSWVFTHGLATAISSRMLVFDSEKEIIDLINSAGRAFYLNQTIK